MMYGDGSDSVNSYGDIGGSVDMVITDCVMTLMVMMMVLKLTVMILLVMLTVMVVAVVKAIMKVVMIDMGAMW